MLQSGMAFEVTILRDAYGMAHVFADTEAGAAFGQGWAQAEDRLEAILRNIKQARGEMAEIDGADALERDVRTRAFRLAELAREGYETQISRGMREIIEAFCAGINRFQAAHPETRPAWAFDVLPEDVATFALFVNLFFASDPAERLPVSIMGGSNAFALAPQKTASGRGSIVSIDPHLPWHGFMRWHEAHLCGGALNVCGITFAGLPLIVAGHNGRVAWARTVNAPDLSDIYEERLVVENGVPVAYEYDGERRALTTREFAFRIRQADGSMAEQAQAISYTHHGPLLMPGAGKATTAYAIRKSGWGDLGLFDETYAQCVARTASEYRQSLKERRIVMFNHVFGDDAGQIGYIWAGRIPARPEGFDFRGPVPGWTPATEWGDPVPLEGLPQAMDAPQGFLQNCNDSPFVCGAGESLKPSADPADYPDWLAPDIRTLRGTRQTQLLKATRRVSVEEAMAITTDVLDLHAERELDALLEAARQARVSGADGALLAECVRMLSAWDRRLTADAKGAALFQTWLWDARINPVVGGFIERGLPPMARGEGAGVAVAALLDAGRSLHARGVPLDVAWGFMHRHRRGNVDLPMDGGGESLVPNSGTPGADGRMACVFGSSFRMLVELGNGDVRAWSVSPYGVRDDPTSPHYADQMPLAASRRYRRVPWSRDEVEREATARIRLPHPEPT